MRCVAGVKPEVHRAADRLEDRLGAHEPPYRSRGEAQVGRVLDRYGIGFDYERPTPVTTDYGQRFWRPDFTLPGYDDLIVEYAGMPDRPDYMAGVRYKQHVYDRNGYAALFVYPGDLTGPDWPGRLVRRLDEAAQPRYQSGNRRTPYDGRC